MKLYNTLTKTKEGFLPIDGKTIKMYACGPTVYDYAHIGNLRTYLNEDFLRRYLEYSGLTMDEVMNITDIEDKIIKRANELKVDYHEVTKKYEDAFLADLTALNIEKPERMPRATEEIDSMISLVQTLLDRDMAYKSEDGSIYFAVKKFKDYGKLAHLDMSGMKEGVRVDNDEYDKENAQDFALWKAKKEGEPSWSAPFGEGRPGWHIECSAMSMKYLGETLDLHAGAVDLVFPHHENEIAQSEAATGKEFVKHWFHAEHLMVNGQKMSKSLGNIYTLQEIRDKYFINPLAFRLLCLQSHYREKLNFTDESIIAADKTLDNLYSFMTDLNTFSSKTNMANLNNLIIQTRNEFVSSMDDDLSTPRAIASLFTFISTVRKEANISKTDANTIRDFITELDGVFCLDLNVIKAKTMWGVPKDDTTTLKVTNNSDVDKLFLEYRIAKASKDYQASDDIRNIELLKHNFTIEDGTSDYILKKINNNK